MVCNSALTYLVDFTETIERGDLRKKRLELAAVVGDFKVRFTLILKIG